MKFSTAVILAVILSGCGDDMPKTTAPAVRKTGRRIVPRPERPPAPLLRRSPPEPDVEPNKSPLSNAATKRHSDPGRAPAPARGRSRKSEAGEIRGPVGFTRRLVVPAVGLAGSTPTSPRTRIPDAPTTPTSRKRVVPLIAATVRVGGNPTGTGSTSPARDAPRLPSIPFQRFLPTLVARQPPISSNVGLPQGSSASPGNVATHMRGSASPPRAAGPSLPSQVGRRVTVAHPAARGTVSKRSSSTARIPPPATSQAAVPSVVSTTASSSQSTALSSSRPSKGGVKPGVSGRVAVGDPPAGRGTTSTGGSPSGPRIPEFSAAEAGRLVTAFLAAMERLDAAAVTDLAQRAPKNDQCPPASVRLTDGRDVRINPHSPPFARGSSTRLFLDQANNVVVKTLDEPETDYLRRALAVDGAFLTVLSGRVGGLPRLFAIDAVGISDHCRARTMVSEFMGKFPLDDIYEAYANRPGLAVAVARAIAKTIEILAQVHSGGLVHGDIHRFNLVYADLNNVPGTLGLIDFGRAEPFVDANGEHVRRGPPETPYGDWNAALLSPWEIEGLRLTRRDDMFRTAEMALNLGGFDTAFIRAFMALDSARVAQENQGRTDSKARFSRGVIDLKRNRPFEHSGNRPVPKVFIDFYRYTLTLKFDEKPDYDMWYRAFSEFEPEPEFSLRNVVPAIRKKLGRYWPFR